MDLLHFKQLAEVLKYPEMSTLSKLLEEASILGIRKDLLSHAGKQLSNSAYLSEYPNA